MNFDTPLIKGKDILELIPQRQPLVMVDTFYGMDENESYTGLEITSSNLFCKEGYLDECGITEHIAQSAAARIGYICQTKGEPVPVGYIGSVDKMSFYKLPLAGEKLCTTIHIVQDIFDITLISAKVESAGKCIAEGQMKIFLKKSHEKEE